MTTKSVFSSTAVFAFACLLAATVLAGFPVTYYGGLLIVIFFGFLLLMRPFYFLVLLLFVRALCDNYFVSIRFTVGGIDLGLGGLFSVFMIAITSFYVVSQRERVGRLAHGLVLFYAAFCAYSLFSAYISADRTGAIKDLVSRYSTFAILIMTLLSIRDSADAYRLLKAVVFSAFLPVIIGFVKFGLGLTRRLEGTLAHPNIMAYFLIVVMGVMVFQIHRERDQKRWPFYAYAYFFLLLAAFVFTLTRSAWAAFFFMNGLYVLLFKRKWIFPLLVLMAAIAAIPVVTERIGELFVWKQGGLAVSANTSLSWRFQTWKYLWNYAVKRPVFGYGINASQFVGRFTIEAHNDYLRFFLESGVFGVFLYFGTYVYVFLNAAANYRRLKDNACLRKLSRFFLCYIPAFLLMSVSENLARYTTVNFYLMALLGIYIALDSIWKEGAARG